MLALKCATLSGAILFWIAPLGLPNHHQPVYKVLHGLSLMSALSCAVGLLCAAYRDLEPADVRRTLKTINRELYMEGLAHWTVSQQDRLQAQFRVPGFPAIALPSMASPPGEEEPPVVMAVPEIVQQDETRQIARYDGHVLLACRTRSGKTTTMQASVYHAWELHQGSIDFWIFDPKGSYWLGLERNRDRYLFCNTPDHVPAVIERLERLWRVLQERQGDRMENGGVPSSPPRRIVIVLDEYNNLNTLAKLYDKQFPPKENPQTANRLKSLVTLIINMGAEDQLNVWLMAQTHRVEQLGLATSVQDNTGFYCQARNGDYQSVEDAISDRYVVPSQRERRQLQLQLQAYRENDTDKKVPIAFSTLGGNRLCQLPDLEHVKTASVVGAIAPRPMDSTPVQEAPPVNFGSDLVNRLNQLFHKDSALPESDLNQIQKPSELGQNSPSQDAEWLNRITDLKQSGLNQNQIILAIWQAKPGGNKAYQNALAEYKRLTE